jgi:Putative Ig domain./Domain of unknown function.
VFDKKDPHDVVVTFSTAYNFLGLKNGSKYLEADQDYSLNGTTVTVKASYLATIKTGSTSLRFDFDKGVDPCLKITVKDTSSKISLTKATFKDSGKGNTLKVKVTYNGNTLSRIINDGYELVKDTDYLVSGNYVTIKNDYLASLPNGHSFLKFDFNLGTDPILDVNVTGNKPVTGPLTFTNNQNVPQMISGKPYSYTFTAKGGSGSGYTYSIDGTNSEMILNVLNLKLSSNGVLSGTIPKGGGGSCVINVKVTDSAGNSVVKAFLMWINPSDGPLNVVSDTITVPVGGHVPTFVCGGTMPYKTSITGALPNGLTWNSAGMFIDGTPESGSEGSYPLKITVTDSSNPVQTLSTTISLVVTSK